VKIQFPCPGCSFPGSVQVPPRANWRCPSCGHEARVAEPPAAVGEEGLTLHACGACGNAELYKMKGFPHWLGLTILTAACAGFLVLNAYRLQWWAWAVLIGSAIIDGVLYLAVKDVVVCYRCGARHKGVGRSGNKPFELTVHERYRQERLRREQLTKNDQ
jgi:hypothetical protein